MTHKEKCAKLGKETEALIAASIYNELDAKEQAVLEKHMAANPAVHAQWLELRTLADVIPVAEVEFRGDLLPALRQQIAEDKQRQLAWMPLKWIAPFAVAGVAVTAIFSYGGGIPFSGNAASPGLSPALPAIAALAPMGAMLAEAETLAGQKRWQEARGTLSTAVSKYPDDILAPQAHQRLAELHFGPLGEYPQAYAEYARLRERFPEAFAANPANVDRFNILSEARTDDYAPLYLLEDARNSGDASFTNLETLVAQHPNTFLASLAVDALREHIPVPTSMSGASQVLALEEVRDRCSHPVAVAQVNLNLGHLYAGELGDTDTARTLYQTVAETAPPTLARSAREALEALAKAQ